MQKLQEKEIPNLKIIKLEKDWSQIIEEAYLLLNDLETIEDESSRIIEMLGFVKYVCNTRSFIMSARESLELKELSAKLVITNNPILVDICEIIQYRTSEEIEEDRNRIEEELIDIRLRNKMRKKNEKEKQDLLGELEKIKKNNEFLFKENISKKEKIFTDTLAQLNNYGNDVQKNLSEVKKLAQTLLML